MLFEFLNESGVTGFTWLLMFLKFSAGSGLTELDLKTSTNCK